MIILSIIPEKAIFFFSLFVDCKIHEKYSFKVSREALNFVFDIRFHHGANFRISKFGKVTYEGVELSENELLSG